MELFTFFAAVYCFSHRSPAYRKRQKFYVVCGGVLLALVTCSLASNALMGQFMWIDHRNDPGHFVASQSLCYFVLGTSAFATANFIGDGLLVRSISPRCADQMKEREMCLTQWPTAVSMLPNLGYGAVYSGASGAYIPGFHRCDRNQ